MLAPEGEGGGIGKNIRLIYGICVVFVCINPIKEIVVGIKDLDIGILYESDEVDQELEDIFNDTYSSAEIENLRSGIKRLLYDRFAVEEHECSVSAKTADSGALETVYITLYGSAIFKNTDEIEAYFEGMLGCETVTVIG